MTKRDSNVMFSDVPYGSKVRGGGGGGSRKTSSFKDLNSSTPPLGMPNELRNVTNMTNIFV